MKRSKQKVVIQEPFGGLHIKTVRRTVKQIKDHGEFWTGKAVVDGVDHQVKLVSRPDQADTWYTQTE